MYIWITIFIYYSTVWYYIISIYLIAYGLQYKLIFDYPLFSFAGNAGLPAIWYGKCRWLALGSLGFLGFFGFLGFLGSLGSLGFLGFFGFLGYWCLAGGLTGWLVAQPTRGMVGWLAVCLDWLGWLTDRMQELRASRKKLDRRWSCRKPMRNLHVQKLFGRLQTSKGPHHKERMPSFGKTIKKQKSQV